MLDEREVGQHVLGEGVIKQRPVAQRRRSDVHVANDPVEDLDPDQQLALRRLGPAAGGTGPGPGPDGTGPGPGEDTPVEPFGVFDPLDGDDSGLW